MPQTTRSAYHPARRPWKECESVPEGSDSLPKGTGERLNAPEPRRSPNFATCQISFKQQSFGMLDPIARNLPENGPPNSTGEPTFERPPGDTQ